MADDSFSLVAFDKAHYFSFPCHCRGETRMRVSAGRRRLCADAMAGPRLSSAVPEPRASSREPGAQPPGWGPHSPVGGRPGAEASPSHWGAGPHCCVAPGCLSSQPNRVERRPWRTVVTGPMAAQVAAHRWACFWMSTPALQRTILRPQVTKLGAASSPFWAMPDHGAL